MKKEWFGEFTSKVTELSKKTGKNVNYLVSIKKIELEILKINHEITKLYKAIGEIVYSAKTRGLENTNVDILCNQIDSKKSYIGELEKRIELIKENKQIDATEVQYDEKIPEFIKNPNTDEKIALLNFCPKCNTGNELTREKCSECGEKLPKKTN